MNKTIGSVNYVTSGAMSVSDQFALARKLAPAIPVLQGLLKRENLDKERSLLTVLMFSNISEEASQYVLGKCINVIARQDPASGNFAKLSDGKGNLMFQDITLPVLMELVVDVIDENLGDFFRTALDSLQAQATAT